MQTFFELEPQVLALSERERLKLIESLLTSLPPKSDEEEGDDSVTMALKREKDAEADPTLFLAEGEFWAGVSNWRFQAP